MELGLRLCLGLTRVRLRVFNLQCVQSCLERSYLQRLLGADLHRLARWYLHGLVRVRLARAGLHGRWHSYRGSGSGNPPRLVGWTDSWHGDRDLLLLLLRRNPLGRQLLLQRRQLLLG